MKHAKVVRVDKFWLRTSMVPFLTCIALAKRSMAIRTVGQFKARMAVRSVPQYQLLGVSVEDDD
jgi:hypothetical protein